MLDKRRRTHKLLPIFKDVKSCLHPRAVQSNPCPALLTFVVPILTRTREQSAQVEFIRGRHTVDLWIGWLLSVVLGWVPTDTTGDTT